MSTYKLAEMFQTLPVIGIDRSGFRLEKGLEVGRAASQDVMKIRTSNALLIRAELADFWLLVFQDPSLEVHSNYILYPNPYPKAQHLKRRWHGHPIFPILLSLGMMCVSN
jgi:tRNA G46 methylase TrmB